MLSMFHSNFILKWLDPEIVLGFTCSCNYFMALDKFVFFYSHVLLTSMSESMILRLCLVTENLKKSVRERKVERKKEKVKENKK